MAVVTFLVVVAVMQWLKISTHHKDFVLVPDLSGMPVPEMRKAIQDSGLRFEVMDSATYNPDYPRFSILEQTPKAGTQVKQNRKIYVTVNPSGYKKVSLPDIIQVTERNAKSMLKAVGLDVQKVSYIDEIGKEMVYQIKFQGREIFPGDKLPKTSAVELICGNGMTAGKAEVTTDSLLQ